MQTADELKEIYETRDKRGLLRRYKELYYKALRCYISKNEFDPQDNLSTLDGDELYYLENTMLKGAVEVIDIKHRGHKINLRIKV